MMLLYVGTVTSMLHDDFKETKDSSLGLRLCLKLGLRLCLKQRPNNQVFLPKSFVPATLYNVKIKVNHLGSAGMGGNAQGQEGGL